ncbi:MAG: tetratricopeptide repeat protein, partial [Planctomycetota bacterium]|nr:tetratricopeptide repeat protein [Planctomycetota bacterium]
AATLVLAAAVSAAAGEEPSARLDLIRRIVDERGEYDLAERQLRPFVEENRGRPAAAEALALLGYCQDKQHKNQEAAASYARVLEEYPQAPATLRSDVALRAADACFRLGRFRDAVRYYAQVIDLDARREQVESALLWRGEANFRLSGGEGADAGEFLAAAAADFTAFLERFPESKQASLGISGAASAYFDSEDYPRALEFFQRFVREFPDDPRAAESAYHAGESLNRLGRHDEAKAAFAALLARGPEAALASDARAGSAWADYDLRRVAEAAAGFEEAAKMAGGDRDRSMSCLYNAGCAWREAGEAQKAAANLLEVAKASDHELNPLALFRLGTLWQEQARAARERSEAAAQTSERDRYREMQRKIGADSIQYFRRALATGKLGDEEIEARALLGEVLLDAGENAAAAREFSELAAKWPDSERAPWALYNQALAERELSLAGGGDAASRERLGLAAAALKQALGYPGAKIRLQAAWALADYLSQMGDAGGAAEQYRWLATEGPGWAAGWRGGDGRGDPALEARAGEYAAESLFRLGESYFRAADYPRAAGFYQEISGKRRDSPQAAMALLRLGEIAESVKDDRAARERYREALELGSRFGQAKVGSTIGLSHLRLGALQLREGQREKEPEPRRRQLQEAIRNLSAVIADPPGGISLSRPYFYLAEARYGLGLKREALSDYEASLRADSRGEVADAAWFGLAWARRDLGDSAAALEACRRVMDDFPASPLRPDALALMASLRRAGGDPAGALADLERFLREFPEHSLTPKAELELASSLAETGRQEEAAEAFQRFLERHPEHPDVPQALYQRARALWTRLRPRAEEARAAESRWRDLTGGRPAEELPEADRSQALAAEKAMLALAGEVTAAEEEILAELRDLTVRHPDYPVVDAAWLMTGEILYDRGDYPQAMDAYRKSLDLAAKRGSGLADKAQYRLAWSLQRLAEEAEAASLRDADPQKREAVRRDMWDKRVAAIDAFESLIGHYPQSDLVGDACFRAAELRRRSGQDNADPSRRSAWFQSAVQRYRQSRERSDREASYRQASEYGEGLCLLLDDKPAEAREIFRRLLLNPDGPYVQDSYWGLGQASLNLGAHADAAAAFEQALAADRSSETAAKSRYGLGLTAAMSGDRSAARLEFLAVETDYSHYPEWAAAALVRASRVALDDGLRDKAIEDLERVLARYPDTPAAAEARNLQADMNRR